MKTITAITACTAALNACQAIPLPGIYPTKDPGDVGRTLQTLSREVTENLPGKPGTVNEVEFDFCGEEPHKKKDVPPSANDPWRVDSNLSEFESYTFFQINTPREAPSKYQELVDNLEKVGGLKLSLIHNTADFPAGVTGHKQDIHLDASHHPSPNGKTNIKVSLRSSCFEHPNA